MAIQAWWRRAEIPAANGHGNARSVAAVQSVIAGRGASGGVRLLSAAGTDPIFEEQANGIDLVIGHAQPLRHGLRTEQREIPLGPRGCRWGGYGGSIIVIDQDAELAVSYVMNRMESGVEGDTRGENIRLEALQAVGGPAGLAGNLRSPALLGCSASTSISILHAGPAGLPRRPWWRPGESCDEQLAVHGRDGIRRRRRR